MKKQSNQNKPIEKQEEPIIKSAPVDISNLSDFSNLLDAAMNSVRSGEVDEFHINNKK